MQKQESKERIMADSTNGHLSLSWAKCKIIRAGQKLIAKPKTTGSGSRTSACGLCNQY